MGLLKISNNTALPAISAWRVKSFWLMVITVVTTLLNALHIDLVASVCQVGLGCTPDQIISTGERALAALQQLLPIISAIWLWVERRAPKFRLMLWGAK